MYRQAAGRHGASILIIIYNDYNIQYNNTRNVNNCTFQLLTFTNKVVNRKVFKAIISGINSHKIS